MISLSFGFTYRHAGCVRVVDEVVERRELNYDIWMRDLFISSAIRNLTSHRSSSRHAGRSRVVYEGIERRQLNYHIWKRDFFTSCINVSLPYAIAGALVLYTASFFFWATVWWWIWK